MKTLRFVSSWVVALMVTLFAATGAAQETSKDIEEHGDEIRERAEWFYRQRAYPLEHIPHGARLRALTQLEEMKGIEQSKSAPFAQPLVSPSWTLIGPRPSTPLPFPFSGSPTVSGRVTALAVDPTNSNVVYLGAADGGVWKTSDGGTNWTPLTDTQKSLSVGAIAIDPSNHNTIYVGTGEGNYAAGGIIGDSYFGVGILKSTNGGSTWTQMSGPFVGPFGSSDLDGAAFIGALAVSPSNSQVLLAGVASASSSNPSGVYRSADGGGTWTLVLDGNAALPNPGTAVLFDPTNGNTAYAALGNFQGDPFLKNGVYKSADAGQHWTEVLGESSDVAGRIALAIAPSNPSTLYASVAQALGTLGGGLLAVYKTTNGGTTWTSLTTPNFCNPQCSYDMAIAVAPNNANVVYATGAYQYNSSSQTTVIRSLDGGSTWSLIGAGANGTNVHTDGHALAFSADSSILYVGTDGGAWSTINVASSPVSWTSLNGTLAITQFYNGLAIDPSNLNIAFAGAQDNGTQKYSGSATWTIVTCGDAGYNAIDFNTPNIVYSACSWVNQPFIQKSTSTGNLGTYSAAVNGIMTSDRASFIPPVVMDPSNSQILYAGTFHLYQTKDGAGLWTAISPDLTSGTGHVATIAVAPSNDNTIYTGSDDGMIGVTTNALSGTSSTWTIFSLVGLSRSITHLAVDPASSTTVYVTYSGFSGFADNHGHVFKTTNGGTSWLDISGNLPNIPVNAIVLDPDIANTLYIATDIGVFVTSNGGTTWSTLGTGLPDVAVLSLVFHHATRTLRAATHGRSAWDIPIPLAGPAPTSTSVISSSNPSTFGQSVTFTATVTATSGTPTGMVTFKDGTTTLGMGTLSGGKATFTTSTLPVGTHSITALYGGDVNFAGSTSPVLSQIVNKAATSTTVVSSANPSVLGQAVTFTATVKSATSGTPTGTVTFKDGATTLGTGTLSTGIAKITVSTLSGGTHSISAIYGGSASLAGSTSPALSQIVTGPDLIETTVNSPPPTAMAGGTFPATDTVKNQGGAASGVSVTRYYLSTDTVRSGGDLLLGGSRSIPALSPGQSSSGTVTVTIPVGTAAGIYFVLACADDTNLVAETNEKNNCIASVTTVTVGTLSLGIGQTFSGYLSNNAPSAHCNYGAPANRFAFHVGSTTTLKISMNSTAFDALICLLNSANNLIGQDDDSGGNLNSSLVLTLSPGNYFIEAMSFSGTQSGTYSLSAVAVTPTAGGTIALGQTLIGNLLSNSPSGSCLSGTPTIRYSFTLSAPTTVTIDAGSFAFDTYMCLFNSANNLLASDDNSGAGSNARIVMNNLTTGTYSIEVTTRSSSVGVFTISFQSGFLPGKPINVATTTKGNLSSTAAKSHCNGLTPADRWRFTLTAPEPILTIDLTSTAFDTFVCLFDSNYNFVNSDDNSGSGTNSRLWQRNLATGTYYIEVSTRSANNTGGAYTLTLQRGFWPVPPTISIGQTQTGNLSSTAAKSHCNGLAPADRWRFTLANAKTVTIDLSSNAFDTYLCLFDANYTLIAFNDNANPTTTNSELKVALSGGGAQYYIEVTTKSPNNTGGSYTLSLN
jgi:hypothetical protein